MLGTQDHLVVGRHILEQAEDINLLLVVGADLVVIGVARDRQDGCVVKLGVVEAIQQVNRAWAAGCEAYAQPPGELCITACGKGGIGWQWSRSISRQRHLAALYFMRPGGY